MSKILIVDDDEELVKALQTYFTKQGYVAEICATGKDAIQLLTSFNYDLVVLDWGLPEMNGDEVCRAYRLNGGEARVIMLTGNTGIKFIEEGLDSGADDYLGKPFDIRELAARVKALLKRRTGSFVPVPKIRNLELKPGKSVLMKGATELRLRAKEVSLLNFLMQHPNQTFSAQQLLEAVWPSDGEGTTNSVRTWINLLRNKLGEIGEENLVKTVAGAGYMIETSPSQAD